MSNKFKAKINKYKQKIISPTKYGILRYKHLRFHVEPETYGYILQCNKCGYTVETSHKVRKTCIVPFNLIIKVLGESHKELEAKIKEPQLIEELREFAQEIVRKHDAWKERFEIVAKKTKRDVEEAEGLNNLLEYKDPQKLLEYKVESELEKAVQKLSRKEKEYLINKEWFNRDYGYTLKSRILKKCVPYKIEEIKKAFKYLASKNCSKQNHEFYKWKKGVIIDGELTNGCNYENCSNGVIYEKERSELEIKVEIIDEKGDSNVDIIIRVIRK